MTIFCTCSTLVEAAIVAGFKPNKNGKLTPIPNSVRFLSTNTSGAASLAFSRDGRFLVVIERLTNDINVFNVQEDGRHCLLW